MLDYQKHYEFVEKKLSECATMPYSEKTYEAMRGYWKDLLHIKQLMCDSKGTRAKSAIIENPSYSNPDTSGKSEFEKVVIEIYKKKPDEETLLKLLKEFDTVAMILKTMHPARYGEFLNKLKAVNY